MSIAHESAQSDSPAATPHAGEFRVQAPTEVLALLRQLLDGQVGITLSNPAGAQLKTRLCALEAEHAALGFEVMPQDPAVQALLGTDEISAIAYLDLIRVAFDLEGLVLVKSGPGAVLRASLPATLLRFQRRQAFRVKPHTRTPQAHLKLRPADESLRLRITDLSVGGIALLLSVGDDARFAVEVPVEGTEIDAQIELDRDTRFRALLRLQHIQGPGEEPPYPGVLLGFAWAQIDPLARRSVQLFIDQTQKLNRLVLRKT
jgi:c-di-GMP-binding flagellar brake protein YcgR